MDAESARWTTVADSPHDHEREALAFLRRRLPDREPYRVWSNFEFTAPSGALYEVDALAVTDNGVHLIEIKSHPGEIGGDGGTWRWVTPEGRRRTFDNPRLLANRKAKALKEMLVRTKAFAKHRDEMPFVSECVFLSDPDVKVTLSPPGRHRVFGRDAEHGKDEPRPRRGIGDIVKALTTLESEGSRGSRRRVDGQLGARIARAVEQAGIRERSSRRRFNDYRLVDLLVDVEADQDTGVAYQDFVVEHVGLAGVRRRLRLYPLERNATADQREAAARAAKREFQHLRALRHPGILAPIEFFEHERGPCLLFDHDPESLPLDRWLVEADQLDVLSRLDVVRQVAEALAHAHRRGVFHRSLCPSAVLVGGDRADPRVQIANWHAGARVATGDADGTLSGTDHVDALAASDAALYRAPEYVQPLADPAALDVFSLGCLACFAFTGTPPAPTAGKLHELLATAGYVPAEAVSDTLDDMLAAFIAELTDRDPANRVIDLDDVLRSLDSLEEEWTSPKRGEDEPHVTQARSGATLGQGRFAVRRRLGMGSTAFALLVRDATDDDRVGVLKIARTPELNPRLVAEAGVLAAVDHPGIVKLLDGPLDLDGHTALLLSYAGPREDADRDPNLSSDAGSRHGRTLAGRIGEPLDAELTERFGEDLLDAVRHLEEVGVAHRDIKPDNLGIAPRGRGHALHLALFDFSLAAAPLDRLEAGTPGYIDPFLRRRGQWDPAAERYAAAVVLYELCTGTKPVYGDGRADPSLVDAPLRLDPALFDSSVADGLTAFFERALAPQVERRHGTAADMLWAWREAFRAGRLPSTTHDPTEHSDHGDEVPPFAVPAGTTSDTALAGLPLSSRAVAALERLDILTVGDLLGEPLHRLRRLRGIGASIRGELVLAVAHLREALADSPELTDDAPLSVAARALVPRRTSNPRSAALLRSWLGLDGTTRWPTVDDLAPAHGGRQQVAEALAGARERWIRQPTVRVVRDWIAEELAAMGGIASDEQLVARLARSRRASDAELVSLAGEHEQAARAMVRAAVVIEGDRTNPRWIRRVLDGPVVVASDDGVKGNGLADYATQLAARTGELVDDAPDAVVGRATLVAALRKIPAPEGSRPLPDAALAELAASLCPTSAVNSRLELYRRGLPAADALRAARRAFVVRASITPGELTAKVAARFPEAERLPERPDLDTLVTAAGIDLRWDPVTRAYTASEPPDTSQSSGSSLSRHATGVPTTSVTPVEIDVAADFEARLTRSVGTGGLLVLVTDRRHLEQCAGDLARFPVIVADFDEWFLAELERLTADGRPSWELVVEADAAGPGSSRWQNLTKVVDKALTAVSERLEATAGTVLLTRCGLLARFQRLDLVARWREALHDPTTPLDGLWLLVTSPGTSDVPLLDGEAVPVLTRNEWSRVPEQWLRNVHRTEVSA